MSEAVSPEFEQPITSPQPLGAELSPVPDNPYGIHHSVHTGFGDPRDGDPLAVAVWKQIVDNRKPFVGYSIAGEEIKPDRETYLRGVRKVIGVFEQYEHLANISSDRLYHESHSYQVSRRKIEANDIKLIDAVGGAVKQIDQLFSELVDENDPLVVTLVQVHNTTDITDKAFYELCFDSMYSFQRQRFKKLIDEEVRRQRKVARTALNQATELG